MPEKTADELLVDAGKLETEAIQAGEDGDAGRRLRAQAAALESRRSARASIRWSSARSATP
jgi:hypothetical protein